jgi:hypothetical protein
MENTFYLQRTNTLTLPPLHEFAYGTVAHLPAQRWRARLATPVFAGCGCRERERERERERKRERGEREREAERERASERERERERKRVAEDEYVCMCVARYTHR